MQAKDYKDSEMGEWGQRERRRELTKRSISADPAESKHTKGRPNMVKYFIGRALSWRVGNVVFHSFRKKSYDHACSWSWLWRLGYIRRNWWKYRFPHCWQPFHVHKWVGFCRGKPKYFNAVFEAMETSINLVETEFISSGWCQCWGISISWSTARRWRWGWRRRGRKRHKYVWGADLVPLSVVATD